MVTRYGVHAPLAEDNVDFVRSRVFVQEKILNNTDVRRGRAALGDVARVEPNAAIIAFGANQPQEFTLSTPTLDDIFTAYVIAIDQLLYKTPVESAESWREALCLFILLSVIVERLIK